MLRPSLADIVRAWPVPAIQKALKLPLDLRVHGFYSRARGEKWEEMGIRGVRGEIVPGYQRHQFGREGSDGCSDQISC
jgi:hypothetical protein